MSRPTPSPPGRHLPGPPPARVPAALAVLLPRVAIAVVVLVVLAVASARAGAWPVTAATGALLALAAGCCLAVARTALADAAAARGALAHHARHDQLTGLANRTGLAEALHAALLRDPEPTMPVAVVVMDLNRFKEVNDTLGHSAGDELLRDVAVTMRSLVDGIGVLARLGGDEFALLLPGADAQAGTAIADLLRQQLREGSRVSDIDIDIDLSAGVAVHAGGELLDDAGRARVAEELLRHADIAMYVAKASGGGSTAFDPALDHHSTARLEIARDLRIAVERDDELVLHFQPKLSAADGRLVGVEALVRWYHPVRGFMSPGDFIPVLERTDLVNAFTDRVLQLGLDQARVWLDAGYDVPVAVNVSPRCLTEPGFTASLAQMLLNRSLPPHLLRVEITEDALVADPEAAAAVITDMRAMGVKTSIDDFGTGYSSLSYLRRLPVDEVKLDRAFVTGLGLQPAPGEGPGDEPGDGGSRTGGDEVLVSSIIELAHRLGMHVVAEGVEHEHELAALRAFGCDVTQGYLHGRPTPASELPAALLATAALARPPLPEARSAPAPAQPLVASSTLSGTTVGPAEPGRGAS